MFEYLMPTLVMHSFRNTVLDQTSHGAVQRHIAYAGEHGVPWGVKDLFNAKGAPTQWGHADFANQVIDEDSEIIVRLRNAGAVLIAKLATGEFAQGDNHHLGQTKNPWNTAQGSSGSSAGPGSATAAGLVGFSIGTETQGSITSPSARNGQFTGTASTSAPASAANRTHSGNSRS